MAQPSYLLQVGLAKEITWGTAVASTTFFPILKPSFETKYESIIDDGYRANASKDQAFYQGSGYTEVNLPDMMVYPTATGNLFMAMLGADAVTGAGPYTHPITLLNSGNPPSYTLTKFDNLTANARQVAGVYFEELDLKFASTNAGTGKLTATAKGRGKIETSVAKPTASFDAGSVYLPWQGALTLGGSSNAKLLTFDLALKRTVELQFPVANSQDVQGSTVYVLEVTGKLTFAPSDLTEYNDYLNNSQPAFSLVFTSGTNTLTLQMSKAAFESPTLLDHGSPYAKVSASFRAIANSTDAGTGNSPIKVIVVNGQATNY